MDDIKDRLDLLLQSFADDRQRTFPTRVHSLRRLGLGQSPFGDIIPPSPDAPPSTPTGLYGPRHFGRGLLLGPLHPDLLPRVSEGEISEGFNRGQEERRKMRKSVSDPGPRSRRSDGQM